MTKNLLLWIFIAVILMAVFSGLGPRQMPGEKLTYSQFLHNVDKGEVEKVTIENQSISGITKNNTRFTTYMPIPDQLLLGNLLLKM